jgi:ribosomal protein L16 Arg81 hydroxylase
MEVGFYPGGQERILHHIKKEELMDKLQALLDHKLIQMDQIRNWFMEKEVEQQSIRIMLLDQYLHKIIIQNQQLKLTIQSYKKEIS